MVRRLDFHNVLCTILGTQNVYFQPPATIQMQFPCIIYSLMNVEVQYGDNLGYKKQDCYEVIVVDKNPDTPVPDQIGALELSSFNRHYVADNLHHYVYLVYF